MNSSSARRKVIVQEEVGKTSPLLLRWIRKMVSRSLRSKGIFLAHGWSASNVQFEFYVEQFLLHIWQWLSPAQNIFKKVIVRTKTPRVKMVVLKSDQVVEHFCLLTEDIDDEIQSARRKLEKLRKW